MLFGLFIITCVKKRLDPLSWPGGVLGCFFGSGSSGGFRGGRRQRAWWLRAALAAKDRRTYWEVCLEGKKVREHWNAEFEATVKCNEVEAADFWGSLPRRQKDKQRMWILAEHGNMKRGDRESKIYMTIDVMHEQLRRYREQELRFAIPPALFKCGQSVLQWWAPWMMDAHKTDPHYNRKNRPAWFSAEVTAYGGYGDIKYAGVQLSNTHMYHAF